MAAPKETAQQGPTLPKILSETKSPLKLVTQGAEAFVYETTYLFPTKPACLKYRVPKAYRHPVLDARLTKHRILAEARLLARCRREGVSVPALYYVDPDGGWIMTEWIDGGTVRNLVETVLKNHEKELELAILMAKIGTVIGRLHASDIVHGDLTSSNLMLRLPIASSKSPTVDALLHADVILIDLGLGSVSLLDEDKAVDLYVLERAFISTHPRAEGLFQEVLTAYGSSSKGARIVLKRLNDVRLRGRKRSMAG